MEFFKSRKESKVLLILRYLNSRLKLSEKHERYYHSLEKGYAGELIFDNIIKNLDVKPLVINDLLLEHNQSDFQIDSILMFQNVINYFEVKNAEGDYYIEKDKWYLKSKIEVTNPIVQIDRSQRLLTPLLKSIGCQLPINYYVIFVNPQFALFQADKELPIILPNQINRFMNEMIRLPSQINSYHLSLAERITALHKEESPYGKVPEFNYDELKKGICCGKCRSIYTFLEWKTIVCSHCGHREIVDSAILRSIFEFRLLCPGQKITVNNIQEFCGILTSIKMIRRVLNQNFKPVGHGRFTYYIDK